ncbi:MAG TPA: SDR family oxidoreductase [Xanthomonadales bacterium]|nr:SDR family oxidoreductase [Xanthomonadales bacterium]
MQAGIITGGGRGVGRAIALRLAQDGPVVLVGRSEADLADTVAAIAAQGGNAIACAGDVADPATAQRALAAIAAHGWTLHHLVCNAGIGRSGATDAVDPAQWLRVFDVNVHGCFHFARAALPALAREPGHALTIVASLAGVRGVAYDAAYTSSKHALVGFARALAAEYRKRGLVVAALCPSFIASEMTTRTIRGVMKRQGLDEAAATARVASKSPAGRILPAEEIAETVALVGASRIDDARALAARGGYPIVGTGDENE